MQTLMAGVVVACAVSGLAGLAVSAQAPAGPQAALSPEVERHIAAAQAAAGTYHPGVFEAVCNTTRQVIRQAAAGPGAAPTGRGRAGGPATPPARETWHVEPQKVFDNLYFVGEKEFSAWAITTSDGIILLDAIFDYSVEEQVVGGLTKLGLNPAQIKYVVISHGHGDHAAGAKYLQDRFGARVVASAVDYDLMDQQNPPWKPKRDIVATDGYKLTLGDTTLTLYLTPGHTEGTISTLIPLRDGNQRHLAAAWGGTLFNFGPVRPRLIAYANSAERFRQVVAREKADVMLSNHTVYDGSKTKLPAVAARRPGQPHPYVIGNDAVQRYLTTVGECAQAAIAGVPAAP